MSAPDRNDKEKKKDPILPTQSIGTICTFYSFNPTESQKQT